MMQDKSHDKADTWSFVERRISEVMQLGQLVNQNQTLVQAVGGGISSIVQGVFVPPVNNDQSFKNE